MGTAGGRDRHNRSETSHGSSKLDTRLRAQQRPGPGRAPERWRRRPHGDHTGTSPRSPAGPHSPTSTLRLGSVSPPPSPNRSYRNSVLLGALVPGRSRWTLVTAPGQGDRTNRQLRVRGRRSGDAGPARGLLGCGGRRRAEPGRTRARRQDRWRRRHCEGAEAAGQGETAPRTGQRCPRHRHKPVRGAEGRLRLDVRKPWRSFPSSSQREPLEQRTTAAPPAAAPPGPATTTAWTARALTEETPLKRWPVSCREDALLPARHECSRALSPRHANPGGQGHLRWR